MRAVAATMRGAALEAWANRSGFWTQVAAMFVNDIVWVVFWFLFFDRVGVVRGWDRSSVLLLLSVLTTGAGLVLGVLGNARALGRMAVEGELDAVLALPVPPLAHLLVRRVYATNLGDVVFGLLLFTVGGRPTPARAAVFVFGVLCSALLFAGFLVLLGSLTFFAGRSDMSDLGFHAMLLFSSYPSDIFGGATKLLLFTVLPAAFVATMPAKLIDDFDGRVALALAAVAIGFAVAGWAAFTIGLRRYTSGALWTRA